MFVPYVLVFRKIDIIQQLLEDELIIQWNNAYECELEDVVIYSSQGTGGVQWDKG